MRSNGVATIMLLIPVLTVPALAIFGIPQFAPVVASPLDEGQEKAKESRVGNSARQSHDDLFADVEEITPEAPAPDDFGFRRRDTVSGSSSDRSGISRRSEKSGRASWSDDIEAESEWSTKSSRRSAPSSEANLDSPRSIGGRSPKKAAPPDRLPSDSRRNFDDARFNGGKSGGGKSDSGQFDGGRFEGGVRIASAANENQRVVGAGFTDDSDPEPPRELPKATRSQLKDPRGSKRRDSNSEPLTWQGAVERLNALDIRNFRLEPGHQLGQFVFICSYTPPDNPRVSYRFEAGADEPLKAVEKVLEQVVDWQQSR